MNNSFKGLQHYLDVVNGVEQSTPVVQTPVPAEHTTSESITFGQSEDTTLGRLVDLINYSNK